MSSKTTTNPTTETTMTNEHQHLNQLIDARLVLTGELEQLATQLAEIEPEAHLEAARQRLQDASEAGADAKALQKLATDAVAAANGTDPVGIQRTIMTGRQRSLERQAQAKGADIVKAREAALNARISLLEKMQAKAIKEYRQAAHNAWQAYLRLGHVGKEIVPLLTERGDQGQHHVGFVETFTLPMPSGLWHLPKDEQESIKHRINHGTEAEKSAVHDPIRTAVLAELGEPLPKQEAATND